MASTEDSVVRAVTRCAAEHHLLAVLPEAVIASTALVGVVADAGLPRVIVLREPGSSNDRGAIASAKHRMPPLLVAAELGGAGDATEHDQVHCPRALRVGQSAFAAAEPIGATVHRWLASARARAEDVDLLLDCRAESTNTQARRIAIAGLLSRVPPEPWRSITVLCGERSVGASHGVGAEQGVAALIVELIRESPLDDAALGVTIDCSRGPARFRYATSAGLIDFAATGGPLELACLVTTHPAFDRDNPCEADRWLLDVAAREAEPDRSRLAWAEANRQLAICLRLIAPLRKERTPVRSDVHMPARL
jgi:hypothetical protein